MNGPSRRWASLLGWVVALAVAPRLASADGAFPDSFKIYTPSDHPDLILLPTNFGLLITQDGAKTWEWSCEESIILFVSAYSVGPPPRDRIYAYPRYRNAGLVTSTDQGCSWAAVTGPEGLLQFTDVFPDPSEERRVLAIAHSSSVAIDHVYESRDGGRTFPRRIFAGVQRTYITGVEIAASQPEVVYLTMVRQVPGSTTPLILRSDDGGAHFEIYDQTVSLRPEIGTLSIVNVDPEDSQRVIFRGLGPAIDVLLLSEDGGRTLTRTLRQDTNVDALSSALWRQDGTILIATRVSPGGYISSDRGRTFSPWNAPIHARGLSERAGRLYAASDNFVDGFAVGVSEDNGATWMGLMTFSKISGVRSNCPGATQSCAGPWKALKQTFGIQDDAGPPGGEDAGDDPVRRPTGKNGCACDSVDPQRSAEPERVALLLIALWLWLSARHRRASSRVGQRL